MAFLLCFLSRGVADALRLFAQAAGVWDKEVMQDYMNEVARQISLLVAD